VAEAAELGANAVPLGNVQDLRSLEFSQQGLRQCQVVAIAPQLVDDSALAGETSLAFGNVALRLRQMMQERGAVHARSIRQKNRPGVRPHAMKPASSIGGFGT
jgi:hypothetical protein